MNPSVLQQQAHTDILRHFFKPGMPLHKIIAQARFLQTLDDENSVAWGKHIDQVATEIRGEVRTKRRPMERYCNKHSHISQTSAQHEADYLASVFDKEMDTYYCKKHAAWHVGSKR